MEGIPPQVQQVSPSHDQLVLGKETKGEKKCPQVPLDLKVRCPGGSWQGHLPQAGAGRAEGRERDGVPVDC